MAGVGDGEAMTAATNAARRTDALDLWILARFHGDELARLGLAEHRPRNAADGHPVLERVARHLETGDDPLRDVPVDLSGEPPFRRQVLGELRDVPPGETVTYGDLARRVGRSGGARAVGNAVAENPVAIVVPCHRVVAADGLGGYSAGDGLATKRRLLSVEGADVPGRDG